MKTRIKDPTTPQLLSALQVAALFGVSLSTLRKAMRERTIPAPIIAMAIARWRHAELLAWIAAGSPPRDEWERSWQAEQPVE